MVDTVTVREETPADYESVRAVHLLAFPDEDVAGLVETLRAAPGHDPALSLVAAAGDDVVGHVLFSPVVIDTADGELAAVNLAPLGVTPEWQNRGVGTKMVHAGLEACRRQGHRIVAVVGHPHYYPRFGFLRASLLGISMTHGRLDEAKMVMALTPGALDGVRGIVRFPSTFDLP